MTIFAKEVSLRVIYYGLSALVVMHNVAVSTKLALQPSPDRMRQEPRNDEGQ